MSAVRSPLRVHADSSGLTTLLRCCGPLNRATIPLFSQRLADASRSGKHNLIVNLAAITDFQDEPGVAALLHALRRVQSGHGSMLLAETPEQVKRAIRARGLALVLQSFDTEEDAAAFLASWRRAV